MSDNSGDIKHKPLLDELTAEQKERLRAATRILIEYLLEKGHPTKTRSLVTTSNEPNPEDCKLPNANTKPT